MEPAELLELAVANGYTTLALTDINCTAGVIEFARLAIKHNITPLAGIDFRNGAKQCYVGIAKNNEGFRELNDHLSAHLHHDIPFEPRAPHFEHVLVIYPFSQIASNKTTHTSAEKNEHAGLDINQLLPHEYVGIAPRDIGRLRFSDIKNSEEKLVALNTTTFRNKRDFNAHRLLRAIANNTLLSKLAKTEEGHAEDKMLHTTELAKLYEDFPLLWQNTLTLAQQCSIDFELKTGVHKNQTRYTETDEGDNALLRKLCEEGLLYRYPNADAVVRARLEKEFEVIQKQKFVSYFLINWDIVNYAKSKGYFYVGRGSGANSIVAYLLRITDVDPLELDLYFERFINIFRQNPPDFDIDFSWKDRDDITRYIFERFKNVALLGAFNTFQYSAVVRELGKVFGLPKSDIDMLSDGKFQHDQLDSMHQLVLQYAGYLKDFPNYITIHACGILITEQPIHSYGATFLPPKGYPTVQFDMHQAEDIAINKLDILSQRGLSKIKDTLDIIDHNQPQHEPIDIHDIKKFKNDPQCNALLREAKAIGCFYVESPAMRMLLTKLQTHSYIGLVAASSVIRPGVSSSGMMRAFILRERIPERRNDAPKPLLELMPETYGVMVYQEDVIKVAHEFAGLDLGEADVLRRGMSGKFRGREEFDKAKENFLAGAIKKGHPKELVLDVWRQVESFAGYAFAKGHSASYAVESYQCLFLKAYFPIEYMVACINNFGGFYRTEIYVHEARMHGATIEGPCINTSGNESVLHGKTIYLGFQFVKSLEHEVIVCLLQARTHGLFTSLDDFLDRVKISLEQSVLLARVGALRNLGLNKKELMWQLHLRLGKTKTTAPSEELFKTTKKNYSLPTLEHHWLEDAYDELELIGFPLCSPFDLLNENNLQSAEHTYLKGEIPASEFHNHIGKKIMTVGYLTTLKPTRTSKGESMYFGTFLDREGNFIDTVHFPDVAKQYRVSGWGLFLIEGKVTEEFNALAVEVSFIRRMTLYNDPRLDDKQINPNLIRKNSGTDKWMGKYFDKKSN
jgi:DNA polymerase-3 subunit alpha